IEAPGEVIAERVQHAGAELVVAIELAVRAAQAVPQREIERVALGGAIEAHEEHGAAALEPDPTSRHPAKVPRYSAACAGSCPRSSPRAPRAPRSPRAPRPGRPPRPPDPPRAARAPRRRGASRPPVAPRSRPASTPRPAPGAAAIPPPTRAATPRP